MQPNEYPADFPHYRVIEPPLEACVVEYPEMVRYAVIECFMSEDEVEEICARVALAEAEADQEMRGVAQEKGLKLTEAAVAALIPLHSKVVDAKADLRAAKSRQRRAHAWMDVVKAHGRALDYLVQLRSNPSPEMAAPRRLARGAHPAATAKPEENSA